jgi:hypothetical protein
MTTIISSAKLRDITADVMDALKAVETRHGIKFSGNGGKYSNAGTGEIKLKLAAVMAAGPSGEVTVALDPNTKWMMDHHGLTDEHVRWPTVGRQCGYAGAWKITGYNSRAPKYPWCVTERNSGKTFRLPDGLAKTLFGKTTRIPFDPPKVAAPSVPVGTSMTPPAPTPPAPTPPARQYESEF